MLPMDIGSILQKWPYESGRINVRKIRGRDGQVKLQMRVELGILQMEMDGRPDGARPHDCESFLNYHLDCIRDHTMRNQMDLGYELTRDQCRELREEAALYYQRYLALFVLEEFDGVERDTGRNLQVLDLCRKYASDDRDKYALEQYRPYILMMNARAKAMRSLQRGRLHEALGHVEEGLASIKEFFAAYGHPKGYRRSGEARSLRSLRKQIRGKLPPDPLVELRKRLTAAVRDERYEEAARLRDELRALGADVE